MAPSFDNISSVAVIGAGLMGHGLAQIFAAHGCRVRLQDVRQEALALARESIRANMSLMAQGGLGRAEEIEPALAMIQTTTELEEAADGAQFVVEAVNENLELKQMIFRRLDRICPAETILATNTSVISISEVAEKARGRDRIVGTHFWNPPYLVPLVEVIRARDTSEQTMGITLAFLARVGKHPVRVEKDVPGFVGNRLQHALWREAISIVEHGIAEPAVVDEVIKFGFGVRLPVLGPLENADLAGLDLTLAIHDYILEHLDRSTEASSLLRRKVDHGELGFKSGVGFQTWSPEAIAEVRRNLQEHLIRWNREQGASQR
ncbi:MAG: 3-hydroxyacyl-CoA dehydrogenase family protein [Proteobacteria bacterium]|nr:3-hydroxyacyl-CoA dehydrogenase family protein [Pseudomonadota bacterium]MBU1449589.1 3-hydroxyacyl-CoA dehydrogenase family protein [Pseudomonadota bacterium]MBU2468358.1 3-hydroxyacyl-CoA dehydrogenase family protein [Pseudomonadota bacterium]MBU2516886.1 3-hydroxyacyl-CoA dehydrogenase family protein [Pseudomonadota bacterium]